MKYEKAQNILPQNIIELIQQYVDGSYLYIPRKSNSKKAWGEYSGIKNSLKKRNRKIFNRYKQGVSVKELAQQFYLTEYSIRRIIRKKTSNIKTNGNFYVINLDDIKIPFLIFHSMDNFITELFMN